MHLQGLEKLSTTLSVFFCPWRSLNHIFVTAFIHGLMVGLAAQSSSILAVIACISCLLVALIVRSAFEYLQ